MSDRTRPLRIGTGAFVAVQMVLLAALGLWIGWLLRAEAASRSLPALRAEPLEIGPLYDDPEVIDDESLKRTLGRLGLRSAGAETSIARVEHALRFWGPRAKFERAEWMSGLAMLALLVDHARFAAVYGPEKPPLLIALDSGVRVRVGEGNASSSHVDHTLAALLEVGIPLEYPLQTTAGPRKVSHLVEQSLGDFRLDQPEMEWSALSYAFTLEPTRGWRASDGQRVSFGAIARRLMRAPLPVGVCAAHHRLHALVVILRADADAGGALLAAGETQEIEAFLRKRTDELVAHQHTDGFWNFDWPSSAPGSEAPSALPGDTLGDRIIVTGHALEWWALAPENLQPPRATVRRAAEWLAATVESLDEAEIERNNSFLTHAGRALRLWRGRS